MGDVPHNVTWFDLAFFLGSLGFIALGLVKFFEIAIAALKMAGILRW